MGLHEDLMDEDIVIFHYGMSSLGNKYELEPLRIPPAFIKHLHGTSLERSTLTRHTGGVWHVKVARETDGVYFSDGWRKFVKDNKVEFGDFLLFKYDGNLSFEVDVYGKTCCEKEVQAEIMQNEVVQEEEVPNEVVHRELMQNKVVRIEEIQNENEVIQRKVMKNKTVQTEIQDNVVKAEMMQRQSEEVRTEIVQNEIVQLEMEQREVVSKGLQTEVVQREVMQVQCEEKDAKVSHICPCKYIPVNKIMKSSASAKKNCGMNQSKKRTDPSASSSSATVPTKNRTKYELETKMVFDSSSCPFKIKHPHFTARWRSCKGYTMPIPRVFVREHLREKQCMLLRDPGGKHWPIRICHSNHRSDFGGGWHDFWSGNKMGEGDNCIFEFLRQDVIQVHII